MYRLCIFSFSIFIIFSYASNLRIYLQKIPDQPWLRIHSSKLPVQDRTTTTLEVGPSDPTQVESFVRDEVDVDNAGPCASRKRGRGKTGGIALTKRRRDGEKLAVDIPPNLMRAGGNNAQTLITECGIIVRQMAPLGFANGRQSQMTRRLRCGKLYILLRQFKESGQIPM